MTPIKLLLVEDDEVDRLTFTRSMRDQKLPYRVSSAVGVQHAKEALGRDVFDIIVADYRLGDGTVFDLLDLKLDTQIVVTTGASDVEVAVKAMKAGAWDFLIKDLDSRYLKILPLTVDRALQRRQKEERYRLLGEREHDTTALVGGPGFTGTLRLLELAAASDSPVFLSGETGTGKSVVAKAIHARSARQAAPFIIINCAALPEQLIEAELFGYEKGAFTGALAAKKGIFELAEGGTLLLDELGDMPVHLQSKLLGVLDNKQVRRLGSETVREVNVRVMASTNADLGKALGHTFRTDLFYRLSVIRISMPPLRARRDDIPELCLHLLRQLDGGVEVTLADGEIERLQEYHWPGNVRELRNILERAFILHRDAPLRPSELVPGQQRPGVRPVADHAPADEVILTLSSLEEAHIRWSIERLSGNITRTAGALGIAVSTLKRKMKELGILKPWSSAPDRTESDGAVGLGRLK